MFSKNEWNELSVSIKRTDSIYCYLRKKQAFKQKLNLKFIFTTKPDGVLLLNDFIDELADDINK